MKNVYFLSDAHLGSRAIEHGRTQERRLVNFLDSIKHKASAVYLLGDMFDFWYEFKLVVPKGYTRFLGKLSELTDLGVEVHFFTGNHDIWCGDYLTQECGVTIHRKPLTTEIYGKEFYLAHGDGLGDPDKKFIVLFAAGCSMMVWSILSFIIEYMQAQNWCEFFNLAGTNSLFVYCLSTSMAKLFAHWGVTQAVYGFYQSYHLPDAMASLLWSVTMVIFCWLLVWPLYRAKLYISA